MDYTFLSQALSNGCVHLVPFAGNKSVKWTLRIASVHGQRAPLPFLKSVEVKIEIRYSSGFRIPELNKTGNGLIVRPVFNFGLASGPLLRPK